MNYMCTYMCVNIYIHIHIQSIHAIEYHIAIKYDNRCLVFNSLKR